MPLKTHLDEQPTLNLTPMIDVVFLLIIFFMVGTKFSELEERKLDLRVPEVTDRGTLTAAPERKVIRVYRDGRIEMDGEAMTREQLGAQLARLHGGYADLGVLIRGDERTPYRYVAKVLNTCRQAGVHDLNLSVRTKQLTP